MRRPGPARKEELFFGAFPLLPLLLLLFLPARASCASLLVEGDLGLLPRLERAGLLKERPLLFFSAYQEPSRLPRLLALVDLVVLDKGDRLGPLLAAKKGPRPGIVNLSLLGMEGRAPARPGRKGKGEAKGRAVPRAVFLKAAPARYKVSVENPGSGGFWIVLGETYHPAWTARIRKSYTPGEPEPAWSLRALWEGPGRPWRRVADHFPANGYANAWYVEPPPGEKSFDVILEFSQQPPFEAGLLAASLLAALFLAWGGFRAAGWIRRSRGKFFRPPEERRGILLQWFPWILPLVLVGAWHAARFFGGGYPLGHDLLASLSLARHADRTLHAWGVLSTWNEQSYGGYSLYSVFPSTFPLFILFLGKLVGSDVLALKLFFFLVFYLAAVPAGLLAREAGFSRRGAAAAAVLYTLLPIHFLEGNIEGHGLVLSIFLLAPLWAWVSLKFLKSGGFSWRWFLSAGLLTYLLFGGHPQYPFFFHPLLFLYVVLAGSAGKSGREAWNRDYLLKVLLLASLAVPAVLLDPGWLELLFHRGIHVAGFNGDGGVPLSFSARPDLLPMFRMEGCCLALSPFFDLLGLAAWGWFWVLAARKLRRGEGKGTRLAGLALLAALLLSLGAASPLFPFLFRNLSFLFRAIRTPGRFLVAASVLAIPLFALVFDKPGRWKALLFGLLLLVSSPEIRQAFLTFPLDRKGLEGEILALGGRRPGAYVAKLPFDYCDGERRGGVWRNSISPFYLSGGRYRTLGGAEPAQSLRTNHLLEEFRKGAWRDAEFLEGAARLFPLKGLLVEEGRDGFLRGRKGFRLLEGEIRLLGRKYLKYRLDFPAPPHLFILPGGR